MFVYTLCFCSAIKLLRLKMTDFPDPDEEFELMYGDELDLVREQDDEGFWN